MLKAEKRPIPIRIYNGIFSIINSNRELDFDRLLRSASANTGLDYLGTDFNDHALRLLIQSINEEAKLNPFGKLMIKEKLIGQLENRLWAEHWFKCYPEILEQQLLPIYLITGLQRTGTTKMQRLLSRQTGARPLLSWEALYPAPLDKPDERAKRQKRTVRNAKAVKYISPVFQSIHPIVPNEPEEDVLLLDVHFMSTSSEAIMHVPTYANWLDQQDQSQAYSYEKKLLQLLQWQQSGSFWVLKSPHHLQYLKDFTKVFPNSKIVWMHREIEQCVPSFLSMLFYSRGMFSDIVHRQDLIFHWIKKLSAMLEAGILFRKQNASSVLDVKFSALMEQEQNEVERIFPTMELKKEMSQETLSASNRYVSKHKYHLKDWGLSITELHDKFQKYIELYNGL